MGGPRALNGIKSANGRHRVADHARLARDRPVGDGEQPGLGVKVVQPGRRADSSSPRAMPIPRTAIAASTGDYTYTLTNDGRRLTIVGVADPCAQRLAAIPGDWLLRGLQGPRGQLPRRPGGRDLRSQFVTPRLDPEASWTPDYGAVTYTVPDGWANAADWPEYFSLAPSADYAGFGADRRSRWHVPRDRRQREPGHERPGGRLQGHGIDHGRALGPGVHRLDPQPAGSRPRRRPPSPSAATRASTST